MSKFDLKKILQYQVPQRVVYSLALFVLCCCSCVLFLFNTEAISLDCSLNAYIFGMHSPFRTYSFFTLAICFVLIYCISGNLLVSYVMMEILTLGWGIANKIVLISREQFITIDELSVFGDAVGVEIDFQRVVHPLIFILLGMGIIVGILIGLLLKALRKDCNGTKKNRYRFLVRISVFFVLICVFISMYAKPEQVAMDDVSAYRKAGCVVWFCQSLFGNATKEASPEVVKEIYNGFKECVSTDNTVSDKRPNIIVIMSEGFWDINQLAGVVEASENPMDKYYELTQDAVTGHVAVNVYGGGTNKPEFEFLTGINSRYLKNANCYGMYYSQKQESFVTYLKNLGYYSMVIHPYNEEFYDRGIGYSNIGFDLFYSEDDFLNRDMCHGYISDKSLTNEIIDRYEEQKNIQSEQPIFTFAISIQNHVHNMRGFDDASGKDGCTGITTTIKGNPSVEAYSEDVEEYYNGMRESIEALEQLVNYFENCEEDTVIVFFGDHAPGFVNQICNTTGRETEMRLYRTPYMIWTNYENEYESYGDFNISYLSSVLIDYLHLPRPNQYYMNMYMLKHYPINTIYEQVRMESIEEQKLLDMMSVVSTIDKRFPKEEMVLPFWSVTE